MYLVFYIIVVMFLFFSFKFFEDQLEDLDLDILTDSEFNWVIAITWPLSMLYFVPVGLANYFKLKRNK